MRREVKKKTFVATNVERKTKKYAEERERAKDNENGTQLGPQNEKKKKKKKMKLANKKEQKKERNPVVRLKDGQKIKNFNPGESRKREIDRKIKKGTMKASFQEAAHTY